MAPEQPPQLMVTLNLYVCWFCSAISTSLFVYLGRFCEMRLTCGFCDVSQKEIQKLRGVVVCTERRYGDLLCMYVRKLGGVVDGSLVGWFGGGIMWEGESVDLWMSNDVSRREEKKVNVGKRGQLWLLYTCLPKVRYNPWVW